MSLSLVSHGSKKDNLAGCQGTLPTQSKGATMTSGEGQLEFSGLCESWQCWQWSDWAVAIAFVGLCVFGLWKAFTDPRMKEPYDFWR